MSVCRLAQDTRGWNVSNCSVLPCCGARAPRAGSTHRHTMPEQLQAHSTNVFQHEPHVHCTCKHPGSALLPCSHQTSGATCHVVRFVGQKQRLAHVLLWCPCCHLHDGPGDSKLLNDAWHAKSCSLSVAPWCGLTLQLQRRLSIARAGHLLQDMSSNSTLCRAAGCCTWQLVAPPWHRMPDPAFINTQFATRQWWALPAMHNI